MTAIAPALEGVFIVQFIDIGKPLLIRHQSLWWRQFWFNFCWRYDEIYRLVRFWCLGLFLALYLISPRVRINVLLGKNSSSKRTSRLTKICLVSSFRIMYPFCVMAYPRKMQIFAFASCFDVQHQVYVRIPCSQRPGCGWVGNLPRSSSYGERPLWADDGTRFVSWAAQATANVQSLFYRSAWKKIVRALSIRVRLRVPRARSVRACTGRLYGVVCRSRVTFSWGRKSLVLPHYLFGLSWQNTHIVLCIGRCIGEWSWELGCVSGERKRLWIWYICRLLAWHSWIPGHFYSASGRWCPDVVLSLVRMLYGLGLLDLNCSLVAFPVSYASDNFFSEVGFCLMAIPVPDSHSTISIISLSGSWESLSCLKLTVSADTKAWLWTLV